MHPKHIQDLLTIFRNRDIGALFHVIANKMYSSEEIFDWFVYFIEKSPDNISIVPRFREIFTMVSAYCSGHKNIESKKNDIVTFLKDRKIDQELINNIIISQILPQEDDEFAKIIKYSGFNESTAIKIDDYIDKKIVKKTSKPLPVKRVLSDDYYEDMMSSDESDTEIHYGSVTPLMALPRYADTNVVTPMKPRPRSHTIISPAKKLRLDSQQK